MPDPEAALLRESGEYIELPDTNDAEDFRAARLVVGPMLAILYNNLAACHLKLADSDHQRRRGHLSNACTASSEVLSLEAGNAKALFRRGCARRLLNSFPGAVDDLKAAAAAAPDDKAVAKELALAIRSHQQQTQALASRLGKMFS
eukprot:m.81373 g.81373  ORF g.81373 m.81373 type:complete len:146 (-) comp14874_c0_seq2:2390-2827(-)